SLLLCDQRREDLNQQILDVTARRLGVPALRDKDQLLADKQALEKQIHQSVPDLLKQDQQLQQNSQAAQQIQTALRQTSIALCIPALADKNLHKLARQLTDESVQIDFHSLLNRDWIDISPLEEKLNTSIAQQHAHNQFVAYWLTAPSEDRHSVRDLLSRERDK